MTTQDREEFISYLRGCTDNQVRGVYDKEHAARRSGYAALARDEATRRGFEI